MTIRTVPPARVRLAAFVAVGAVLLAGCDVSIRDGSVSVNAYAGLATDEWTRRYPLATGGRIEVVNITGPIDVVSGDEGFVEVHATRTVRALADDTAREQLKALTIEEKVGGSLVHLETRVSAAPVRASMEVHYRLTVPRSADVDLITTNGAVDVSGVKGAVRASSTNGSVTGRALAGKVDLTTVNGSINADLDEIVSAGVRLESVNGSVDLRVPQRARANISAKCVNGRVAVTGLPVPTSGPRRVRTFEAQLNGGGPAVEVETTNGAIRIDGKT
jgi:hypothetical protein